MHSGADVPLMEQYAESRGPSSDDPSNQTGLRPTTGFRLTGCVGPLGILVLFTVMEFLTYFDRGLFATVGTSVLTQSTAQHGFCFSQFQYGFLGGSYLVGYVLASPVFAHYSNKYKPLRLMCGGLLCWCLATVGTGLSDSFGGFLVSRMLSGVGEAAFLCLGPPFIEKLSPRGRSAVWLGLFYAAIPTGYAAGFGASGYFLSSNAFGLWTWRAAFMAEALIMTPLVFAAFMIRGPNTMAELKDENDDAGNDLDRGLRGDLMSLLKNTLYVLIVLTYATQTFVTGGFALYALSYLEHPPFSLKTGEAGLLFGIITMGTGLLGSALGGFSLDYLRRRSKATTDAAGVVKALIIVLFCSVLGLPMAVIAFQTTNLFILCVTLVLAELTLFASISPINSAIMWSVTVPMRPLAIAMSTMVIHLLGDALSPAIIGALLDHFSLPSTKGSMPTAAPVPSSCVPPDKNANYALVMTLTSVWLVWPIGFSLFALRSGRKRVKNSTVEQPLLDDGSFSPDRSDYR